MVKLKLFCGCVFSVSMRIFVLIVVLVLAASPTAAVTHYNDGLVNDLTADSEDHNHLDIHHDQFRIFNGTTLNVYAGVTLTISSGDKCPTSYVGDTYTGAGYLNVTGTGQVLFDTGHAVGASDGVASSGHITLSGTRNMTTAEVYMANRADATFTISDDATLYIEGGVNSGGGNYTNVGLGVSGGWATATGTFDQLGGTVMIIDGGVILSRNSDGTGIYNMSGGMLDTVSITKGPGTASVFNFSGGTILIDGDVRPFDASNAWFKVSGPQTANYYETYAAGTDMTTLQITHGPTAFITESHGLTQVQEGGTPDTYELVLSELPTANITITATPGDSEIDIGEGVGAPKLLVFTPSDWNTPQTVTVSVVDDTVYDAGRENHPILQISVIVLSKPAMVVNTMELPSALLTLV